MLPAVGSLSGAGLAGTGATSWLSPSVRTAVPSIKDAPVLIEKNHLNSSIHKVCVWGGLGSDEVSTVVLV